MKNEWQLRFELCALYRFIGHEAGEAFRLAATSKTPSEDLLKARKETELSEMLSL